jgi:DNA-binding response OmpR family regulator
MPPVRHKPQKQQQKLIHNDKKNRILIVNGDNSDNYATLKLDLERNGFIVDTFTDPLAALNNFRAGLFDMVAIDKRMSKMKLVDLYINFKKIDDKVKICILSPRNLLRDLNIMAHTLRTLRIFLN